MKKPDKIYLNKLMIRPGMLYPAQFPPDETEEIYIRKDALLVLLQSKVIFGEHTPKATNKPRKIPSLR